MYYLFSLCLEYIPIILFHYVNNIEPKQSWPTEPATTKKKKKKKEYEEKDAKMKIPE